jgi:iron uptake system EfeUOB component EfeO/EfeM
MMHRIAQLMCVGVIAAAAVFGVAQVAGAADRFEVIAIKAVRPTLVDTANALQKGNVKAAKDAFGAFDSAWNGIEVYINTRDPEMYNTLERVMQAKLTAGLNEATPNTQDLLAQAKAMLAKFDEAVTNVEKAAPLNPLFDDVARLRTVRAHLREVNPALKAGDLAKARKSFSAFDDKWDSIEDLVKARDVRAYNTIEEGMTNIGLALKPVTPDVNRVTTLVSGVMDEYNKIVAEVTKEARAAK